MPLYSTTYSLSSGREIREKIQGPSAEIVRVTLRARGYFPTAIREVGTPARQRRLRIPTKTLARLLRQESIPFIALDVDPQRIKEAAAAGAGPMRA